MKPICSYSLKEKLVSIIIPIYNRKEFLTRALNSIFSQTVGNYEILVVDDASSDDLLAALFSLPFPKEQKEKIRYFRNSQNFGVSYSRNVGIKNAKGDCIAFLDSDDEWVETKLQLQLDYFSAHSYRVVHSEEIWIRDGVRVNPKKKYKKSGGDLFLRSLHFSFIAPSSVIFKREVFEEYGLFDESLPVCEDYDLWLRILSCEEFGFIDSPLVIRYAGHADQLSQKYEAMDQYRVVSLLKLWGRQDLSNKQRCIIKDTILFKLKILLSGAKKREKYEDIARYQAYFSLLKES